jgi:hypothetical protein
MGLDFSRPHKEIGTAPIRRSSEITMTPCPPPPQRPLPVIVHAPTLLRRSSPARPHRRSSTARRPVFQLPPGQATSHPPDLHHPPPRSGARHPFCYLPPRASSGLPAPRLHEDVVALPSHLSSVLQSLSQVPAPCPARFLIGLHVV